MQLYVMRTLVTLFTTFNATPLPPVNRHFAPLLRDGGIVVPMFLPDSPPIGKQSSNDPCRARRAGLAQLSLVEHALCPLDADLSIRGNHLHEAHYGYSDAEGKRRTAHVRVTYPNGLSPNDEFYLWSLIALTFAQPTVAGELHATPHFCLRQLGLIDQFSRRGGKDYKLFRAALWRLSAVTYFNSGFYDPVRGEHRDRSFGFLKYDLPLDAHSNRAWRIVWDPLFFEFCQATGGRLFFDLGTYRALDFASRRLYLFLHKLFWRRTVSPALDVRYVAQQVMGLREGMEMWHLKQKLARSMAKLIEQRLIALPLPAKRPQDLFRKKAKGCYTVQFHRGPHFNQQPQFSRLQLADSPLYGQLESIGFESPSIRRILTQYPPDLITAWADVTLAAIERKGRDFFTTSPEAFFIDNIREAAKGKRTPPDWWRELRKAEEQTRRRDSSDDQSDTDDLGFDAYLQNEARETFKRVSDSIFANLTSAGHNEAEARERAVYIARMNLRAEFRRQRRAA